MTTPIAQGPVDVNVRALPEPFAYVWEEHWQDADTQNGPGEHNSELCFDTEPPKEGVRFSRLYTEDQVIEMLRPNAEVTGA